MMFFKKSSFIYYFFFCCFFVEVYADFATIDGVLEFFGSEKSSRNNETKTEAKYLEKVSLAIEKIAEKKDKVQCNWREDYKRSCFASRKSEEIRRTDHRYFEIEVR
jgi:hypothetical protein